MSEPAKPPRPRPVPVPDPETAPYWDAANEGRLLLQRCTRHGHRQLYPRPHCVVCRGPVEWEEASGRATVYSFTIIRQNMVQPFRNLIPYVVALVDLEEGPRLMTNIVDCDFDKIKIGQPVRLVFKPSDGGPPVPMFTPV